MSRSSGSRARPWAGCGLAALTLFVGLACLEGGLQMLGFARREASRSDPTGPLVIERDPRLGWRPAPDRDLPAQDGGRFTTGPRGWRRFDGVSSSSSTSWAPLMLVIGDSFTHAVGVADGATYFDRLATALGMRIAALGVNGYGPTQELLFIGAEPIPAPRWVLLQMHDNDVVNDSWVLERRSWRNNNLMARPYLEAGGRIVVRDPRRWFERLVLGRQLTRVLLSRVRTSVEERIEAGEPGALALYHRELAATGGALAALRGVFGDRPAFTFNAAGGESRIGRDLARLARGAGWTYLELGPELRRRGVGRDIRLADGAHWNAAGHALVGEILAEQLRGELVLPE